MLPKPLHGPEPIGPKLTRPIAGFDIAAMALEELDVLAAVKAVQSFASMGSSGVGAGVQGAANKGLVGSTSVIVRSVHYVETARRTITNQRMASRFLMGCARISLGSVGRGSVLSPRALSIRLSTPPLGLNCRPHGGIWRESIYREAFGIFHHSGPQTGGAKSGRWFESTF